MPWKQWKELWETAYGESGEVNALSLPAFRRLTAADIPSLTKKWNKKNKKNKKGAAASASDASGGAAASSL
jgi:hypothetical protein